MGEAKTISDDRQKLADCLEMFGCESFDNNTRRPISFRDLLIFSMAFEHYDEMIFSGMLDLACLAGLQRQVENENNQDRFHQVEVLADGICQDIVVVGAKHEKCRLFSPKEKFVININQTTNNCPPPPSLVVSTEVVAINDTDSSSHDNQISSVRLRTSITMSMQE